MTRDPLSIFLLLLFFAKLTALGKEDKEHALNPISPLKPDPITPAECICPEDDEMNYMPPPHKEKETDQAEQIINFENEIQNIVYVK